MRRIGLVGVLTLAILALLAAGAQPTGRTVTIGYLGNSSPSHESHLVEALREGLRELGYVEGRNLAIKYAWAEGRPDRFPVLARELVDLKPDVILTAGTPGALAAKQATRSIPIVMAVVGNPLEVGLVSSLAKPGGNATGLSALGAELEGKTARILDASISKALTSRCSPQSGQPVHGDRMEKSAACRRVTRREARKVRSAKPE
jgi:putative ABC transport system substrate-binding protein